MYACNGLLFNHESPRRGETFVTRKITRGLSRIDAELEECIYMGNLDALRDWGHARDYVEMQWRMLQQNKPQDFVIATGRQESVRKFIELSANALGWGSMKWEGKGMEEIGRRADTGAVVVRVDTDISARQKLKRCSVIPPWQGREAGLDPKYNPRRDGERDDRSRP